MPIPYTPKSLSFSDLSLHCVPLQLSKTALSSADYVRTRHFASTSEAIHTLKSEGYMVYAMETTSKSKVYTDVEFPRPSALVLGNELTGVCTEVLVFPGPFPTKP